jgi:hypothetical protein
MIFSQKLSNGIIRHLKQGHNSFKTALSFPVPEGNKSKRSNPCHILTLRS